MIYFAIVLVILALATVGFASSMSYEEQTIVPFLQANFPNKPFEALLSKIEVTYWNELISVETRGYFHFVEFLIRKFTHFAGYGIVAIIIYLLIRKLRWRFAATFAVMATIVIACLDELRQKFSPGRTGIIDDVYIDAVGAVLFVLLAKLILWLINRRRQ